MSRLPPNTSRNGANGVGDDDLFDPTFLSRLRSLFFKLRKHRQLNKKGAQQTPAVGHTREFKDHRQYTPGDDYREIDWRLFARLERLFIRLFEEVQEFHVHIIVDNSTSMVDPHASKRMVALRLAAALAYLALINQHRVSVHSMGDRITRELPPLKGQGHILPLLRHLTAMPFEGVTDLDRTLGRYRPKRGRKGVAFVISDLFGPSADNALRGIEAVGHWPTESHIIHLLDPWERRPDLEGELQLLDTETGEIRRMWLTRREMQLYAQTIDAFCEQLRQACSRQQTNYLTWTTDLAFEEMFLTLLSRGSALAQR